MPTLFCRPINALANRLMTIISCQRLAEMWGYDLHVVWECNLVSFFRSSFQDLFISSIESSLNFPEKVTIRVETPKLNIGGRVFFERSLDGKDVLIDGWRHFCFDVSDVNRDPEGISQELRATFLRTIRPSDNVVRICKAFGLDFNSEFDLGVHLRVGALDWINNSSVCSDEDISLCFNDITQKISPRSIYVSGTSASKVSDFYLKHSSYFDFMRISPASNHESEFYAHALAVGDFYQFTKCSSILNVGVTTYSSLAGLIGDCKLYTIVGPKRYVLQKAVPFSGIGL